MRVVLAEGIALQRPILRFPIDSFGRRQARLCALIVGAIALMGGSVGALAGPQVSSTLASQTAPSLDSRRDAYHLQPGDVLQIEVWQEKDLQRDVLIRPDGGISFPLAGELTAAGRTVAELDEMIEQRIRKYVPAAVVTVAVKSTAGNRIFVIGKVQRPGDFPLIGPTDVLQALALAGGGTPFANMNDIRILRRNGDRQTAKEFRYGDVERGRNLQQNILLHGGDTVVVP
ncbi:MAG: polysaccharide biosynthesis/export family protein [Gammaproteobacteria bacterium]|nr:polysaccharide biosynthesis/export family protein [Gammaproteobacteria bacterium]